MIERATALLFVLFDIPAQMVGIRAGEREILHAKCMGRCAGAQGSVKGLRKEGVL
jgi:hypothetical protein